MCEANRRVAWALALLALLTSACDPGGPSPSVSDTGASPNPSVQPLETATSHNADAGPSQPRDAGDAASAVDAARPQPRPLDPYERLGFDRIGRGVLSGVTLEARWRWRKVPAAAKAPHIAKDALEAAAAETQGAWRISLASIGRMRADFLSRALPLPRGAALMARADRYGTAVLWPEDARYRVVAPGALRALLGERRVDVSPLARGKVSELGAGKRLELTTRKVQVRSSVGSVTLELAPIPEAGRAAPLLCRLLLELAGVDPSSKLCMEPEVALSAELSWGKDAGGIGFEVTSLDRQTELTVKRLQMPPAAARHTSSGLPGGSGSVFTKEELASFRSEAAGEPNPPEPNAPREGLLADNRSDSLLYLLLDGIPIATVPAWSKRIIKGPRNGRYNVQWRTFLGEVTTEPVERDLPAYVVYGQIPEPAEQPDAG